MSVRDTNVVDQDEDDDAPTDPWVDSAATHTLDGERYRAIDDLSITDDPGAPQVDGSYLVVGLYSREDYRTQGWPEIRGNRDGVEEIWYRLPVGAAPERVWPEPIPAKS